MDEPERDRDSETNEDGEGNNGLTTARSVEDLPEGTPGDDITVERLYLLTGPLRFPKFGHYKNLWHSGVEILTTLVPRVERRISRRLGIMVFMIT